MAKKEEKANVKKERKHYFKEFKAELKKVIWLTPKQLVNSTFVVVSIVLIIAAIVFVLDIAFDSMNKYGINKLQAVFSEQLNTTDDNTTNSEEVNTSENTSNEVTNSQESDNVVVDNTTNETNQQ